MRFRQSTVLVITAAIFGLVSVLLAACVLLTRHQVQSAEATSKRAAEFRQLGIDLGNASDFLTNQARIFSVTGDQRYLTAYWNEINVTRTRDHAIAQLKLLGAPADELALLDKAKHNSDALVNTEARSQRLMEEALGVSGGKDARCHRRVSPVPSRRNARPRRQARAGANDHVRPHLRP